MSAANRVGFDREDLIDGLRQLISQLRNSGQPAGIRIIGGAAVALRYFDRRTTVDIDAVIHPSNALNEAAHAVALRNG